MFHEIYSDQMQFHSIDLGDQLFNQLNRIPDIEGYNLQNQ